MTGPSRRCYNAGVTLSVELNGLAKSFNKRPVFDNVTTHVEDGHALAISGPNGSGKSTLLRVLCGLLRPSRGSVTLHVDGQPLAPAQAHHLMGLVAPDVALYGELTGLENMAFFARVRGRPADPQGFAELLARVGLPGRGDDEVRTYSSGMRQRLKYACALLHHPPLLILDEPTANLDEVGIGMVKAVMAEQRRGGVLIFATNDPQELSLGDDVLRLGTAGGGR